MLKVHKLLGVSDTIVSLVKDVLNAWLSHGKCERIALIGAAGGSRFLQWIEYISTFPAHL